MLTTELSSVAELRKCLDAYGDEVLFRGQTRDFSGSSTSGLKTSFDRQGCVPPKMLPWTHYAKFALVQLRGKPVEKERTLEFNQAILQHYGWRSFFLDATESHYVAAWFAGNSWYGDTNLNFVEDCFEDPVLLRWQHARYEAEDGDGFLYVISKAVLAEKGVGTTALSEIEIEDCRPRFHAQKAWLVGPLRNEELSKDCVLARIKAPRSVLRDFAETDGLKTTEDLFPSPVEDPVLAILLSMPWVKIPLEAPEGGSSMPDAFHRSIELPEYSSTLKKIMPDHVAFFSGQRASDIVSNGPKFVQIPDIVIFGTADPQPDKFPNVAAALEDNEHLAFEIDQITWLPESCDRSDFGKGLVIERTADGTIAVSDLIVHHPGKQLRGVGVNMPWHYRIGDDGVWRREHSAADCPCENEWRHKRHLSALTIIDYYLAESSDLIS